MIDLSKYVRWDLVLMCVALAVVFGFEMLGVFTDKYVTITAIVRETVPKWARAMVCGWLFYHFVIQ
jgi:hypothetical protein